MLVVGGTEESWRRFQCGHLNSTCSPGDIVPRVGGAPAIRRFPDGVSVATLTGAPVSRIVVKQYRHRGWARDDPDWDDIQKQIRDVWSATVQEAYGEISWAEGSRWNVFAELEFEKTARRGSLLTDGVHIQVRDVKGRYLVHAGAHRSLRMRISIP